MSIQAAIEQFRNAYAEQVTCGISRYQGLHGRRISQLLRSSITNARSTIYMFGNGGSHAICKCIGYALEDYASALDLPIRVETGVDVHKTALCDYDINNGMPFMNVLKTQRADSRDTVVLISGSGNADNLCEAAAYASRFSIPTYALVGSGRGKMREIVSPEYYFSAELEDQQISEDVIQSVAYFLASPSCDGEDKLWSEAVSSATETLSHSINQFPCSFIARLADDVVTAFERRKFVWVLGFGHSSLSVCAEHTAHNLYWDGIYQVHSPPQRFIKSSSTACDFSGISNDRRKGVVESLTGINEAHGLGVALLYATNLRHPSLHKLLSKLEDLRVPTFLVAIEDDDASWKYQTALIHQTKLKDQQIHAGLTQMFGHILGRIVRMKLLSKLKSNRHPALTDPAQFLINFDLAQRRMLDD